MSIGQQIHDIVVVELENFRLPEVLFIGINKYRKLIEENRSCSQHSLSYINTPTGNLKIEILYNDPDGIYACENHLMWMLQKLGVEY